MEFAPWMIVVAIAVLIGFIALVARFFLRLLKHIIIAVVFGVVVAFVWVQMQPDAPVNPLIGKRAYSSANGQFVGIVVASGADSKLGDVLIIEQPGGNRVKYPKNFLRLRDR